MYIKLKLTHITAAYDNIIHHFNYSNNLIKVKNNKIIS